MAAVNEVCPWSGKAVDPEALAPYRGRMVGFCNVGCRDKFVAALDAFDALIDGSDAPSSSASSAPPSTTSANGSAATDSAVAAGTAGGGDPADSASVVAASSPVTASAGAAAASPGKRVPVASITRRETFSACHRLHASRLSDEANRDTFGKCNHPGGHGHNYVLKATVRGVVSRETGMVMNITDLKAMMEDVLRELDHRNLDSDVGPFAREDDPLVSTTENLAVYIWDQLQAHPRMPTGALEVVHLRETEKNSVTYRGPE